MVVVEGREGTGGSGTSTSRYSRQAPKDQKVPFAIIISDLYVVFLDKSLRPWFLRLKYTSNVRCCTVLRAESEDI